MNRLQVHLLRENKRWLLRLRGTLQFGVLHLVWGEDDESALWKQLEAIRSEQLIIDLEGVSMVDAYGLSWLLQTKRALAENHTQIILLDPRPGVERLLRLVEFDHIFRIESSPGG